MLYREQTFAPRAFHSELQQQTNTVNTQKSPPWACDKGCAEACAERFSALNPAAGCETWIMHHASFFSEATLTERGVYINVTFYRVSLDAKWNIQKFWQASVWNVNVHNRQSNKQVFFSLEFVNILLQFEAKAVKNASSLL